jgi:DNA-binding SARP family transcriptional activator
LAMGNNKNTSDRKAVPPAFRIWLCGTFHMERQVNGGHEVLRTAEWGGSSYPRLLLKALLHYPGRQARREALIDLLWPEVELEQAAQNLNTATTKLRKVLQSAKGQESLLITEDDCKLYRLEGQFMLWVDADEALALLNEAERIGHRSPQAIPLLEEAVTYLSRGAFLEDEDGLWVYGHRKDLKEALYNGRCWLAEAYVEQDMIGLAEQQWRALLADNPSDEDVLLEAMGQFYQRRMTHKAWRLYQQVVEQLAADGQELTRATISFAEQIHKEPFAPVRKETASLSIAPGPALLQVTEPETQGLFRSGDLGMLLPVHGEIALSGGEDSTAWCGGKLAYLLTLVEDYSGQPMFFLDLQERIGKELNTMLPNGDERYRLARRQALITLATLPSALFLTMLQGRLSAGRTEQFLARCAASLAACWHLMKGSEYAIVEELLSTYLPLLTHLSQEASKHQRTAASLATQGCRLKGILALHRNDFKARDAYFQQAVYYAEISQHPGMLVAALISLAYHQPDPVEAEQLYQRALVYEQAASPLQRSRLYAELAVCYGQQNREEDAKRYLLLAQQEYPLYPEADSSFLYAEFSPSSLVLEKGRVHLALTQHQPDGSYPQQAWNIFTGVQAGPSKLIISERIRYEIVNYMAETALALRERDLCCDYLSQGARGAILLGSAKRRKEVVTTRNKALNLWPHEGRVKELKYLFA